MDRSAQWGLISHQQAQQQIARATDISDNVHVGTGVLRVAAQPTRSDWRTAAVRLGVCGYQDSMTLDISPRMVPSLDNAFTMTATPNLLGCRNCSM